MKKQKRNITCSLKLRVIILLITCCVTIQAYPQQIYLNCLENQTKLIPLSEFNKINSKEWRKENNISACKIALSKYSDSKKPNKPIEEMTYTFNSNGNIEKTISEKSSSEFYYNGSQQLSERKVYLKSGKLFKEEKYEYDTGGLVKHIKVVQMITTAFCGKLQATINYNYNDNNHISEVMIYTKEDYEYYRERYKYDDKSRIIESQICQRGYNTATNIPKTFSKINCGTKTEFYYENDKLVKVIYYHPVWAPVIGMVNQNDPQGYKMYSYDNDGNIIEINDFSSDGTKKSKTAFLFNNEGKASMKTEYTADDILVTMESYNYDENGIKNEIIIFDPATRIPDKVIKLTYN
jgi:hypothetical protein